MFRSFFNQHNINGKKLYEKSIGLYKKHIRIEKLKNILKYILNIIFGHILQLYILIDFIFLTNRYIYTFYINKCNTRKIINIITSALLNKIIYN